MVTRLLRFSAAGAAGFAAQVTVLAILVSFTKLHYVAATVLAVEIAILINFIWHDRWTWQDRPAATPAERWRRLARFNAMTGVTSIIGSVAVTAVLVETFALSPIVANIISVVTLGGVNFIGANTLVFRAAAVAAALALAGTAHAADGSLEAQLQPKTAAAFARYVAAVEARRARDLAEKQPFLEMERRSAAEQARIMAMLERGEVFVDRGAPALDQAGQEIPIEDGLVNHWRGTVFVPDVTLDQVLKVLQEPQSDKHKQEDVISSRVISRDGDSQKVFLRLKRTKFVTVVYDTEYDVDYERLSGERALSNSISTKIVEIENAGTARERALPEGNDHGYMWRLNSYWRYKQVDGGVLVEVESLTLSRDLPAFIGALIRPIVNSTARESMTRTLASVRARFS